MASFVRALKLSPPLLFVLFALFVHAQRCSNTLCPIPEEEGDEDCASVRSMETNSASEQSALEYINKHRFRTMLALRKLLHPLSIPKQAVCYDELRQLSSWIFDGPSIGVTTPLSVEQLEAFIDLCKTLRDDRCGSDLEWMQKNALPDLLNDVVLANKALYELQRPESNDDQREEVVEHDVDVWQKEFELMYFREISEKIRRQIDDLEFEKLWKRERKTSTNVDELKRRLDVIVDDVVERLRHDVAGLNREGVNDDVVEHDATQNVLQRLESELKASEQEGLKLSHRLRIVEDENASLYKEVTILNRSLLVAVVLEAFTVFYSMLRKPKIIRLSASGAGGGGLESECGVRRSAGWVLPTLLGAAALLLVVLCAVVWRCRRAPRHSHSTHATTLSPPAPADLHQTF